MDVQQNRATRKSLPLTARDLEDIAKLRSSATHRAALAELSDIAVSDSVSDARLIHAALQVGLREIRRQVEEAGYAEMAAQTDTTERKAVARRRRPRWADE